MSSALAELPVVQGVQLPRLSSVPEYVSSAGGEAIELAAMCGLELDRWQQHVLRHALGERKDGKWAASEVGLIVARQNGKGAILEARELAGLFLLDEWLLIHSAHLYDTAMEAFRRLTFWITETPELSRRVKRVVRSHGDEGIELTNGKRIRFRTRTNGGGRGLTGDCVILDEAMELSKAVHGSLMPTLSAVPNPQLWYTGSAVDEDIHPNGQVFAKVRERGIAGDDPKLAFFEWSVDPDRYHSDPACVRDPACWAEANPAQGIRIAPETIAGEQRSMYARTFAVERLSVGYWPKTTDEDESLIPKRAWEACGDPKSTIDGPVTYSVDVSPQRDKASIAAGGHRPDSQRHVEVVASRAGVEWVVERCVELHKKHGGRFVIDPKGQARVLIPDLVEEGLEVHEMTTDEAVAACAEFYDGVLLALHEDEKEREKRLRYPDPQVELTAAVSAAATRAVGEAWAWSRRAAAGDITALVAATNALWGAEHLKPEEKGVGAASMADYLKRNGMADPKARQDRLKDLAAKRQARVDAVLKKARGEE